MTKDIFSSNKTSAKLLVDFAKERFLEMDKKDISSNSERFLMIYDLYIKAKSYIIINKISFWFAIAAGIMVLLWPSIAIVSKDFGFDKEFLKSAIVQTTITAIAALTFSVYSHYKKRQLFTENLMRYVVLSEDSLQNLKDKVIQEMERIDMGFSFSQAILKKETTSHIEENRK